MHKPSIRIVPGAQRAILFIHGIVGTPEQFRCLMPLEALVPEAWSYCNVLLPGHGESAEAFGSSSMEQWRAHANEAFLQLAQTHEQVMICAHSMGTLFALQLGVKYPEKISQLFLLAVPMRPGLRWFGIENIIRVGFGRVRPDHPLEVATQKACGVQPTKCLWKYIPWIPRMLELFREIYRTEKVIGEVRVPCIAFQSCRDELVTNHSGKILGRYGNIQIRELKGSSHFYYTGMERETVTAAFTALCSNAEQHD